MIYPKQNSECGLGLSAHGQLIGVTTHRGNKVSSRIVTLTPEIELKARESGVALTHDQQNGQRAWQLGK